MGPHPARPVLPRPAHVVRVRGLAYGGGQDRMLDVYHRRDRPSGAPVLLHLHGGRFYSGHKAREARPLIRYLTSRRGFVCVSADYRLQPHVTLAGQVADVRDAIAWVRAHAAEFGAEPGTLFLAGSSAGANLAIRAVCDGETGIAGLICRYGYYGGLEPRGDLPPVLIVHGEKDLISAADVRAFAERVRACRAARSATPSCPVRTTTSTCTSPSGPPQSTRQWTSSLRGSADSPTQSSEPAACPRLVTA